MNKIPFVAFCNAELGETLAKGEFITCKNCRKQHKVKLGINSKTKQETNLLMFYNCGKKSFLAGIAGKRIP